MCDELGFYVMLETDIETHGFAGRTPSQAGDYDMVEHPEAWPGNRTEWEEAYMERMVRAYERDKTTQVSSAGQPVTKAAIANTIIQ